jgi:hypothetical protein
MRGAKKRMVLMPAPGRKIRAYHDRIRVHARPPYCYLAEDGEEVPMCVEYQRALTCGDLLPVKKAATRSRRARRTAGEG